MLAATNAKSIIIYSNRTINLERMYTETYLTKPSLLLKKIYNLHLKRRKSKLIAPRAHRLTKEQRKNIHAKTNGRCHFCGIKVPIDKFQADHVVSKIRGGAHNEENYLPSCFTCNNYRWHYLPRELQIILKLGVWVRTEIEHQTIIGKEISNKFTKKESVRMSRNNKVSN